MKEERSKSEFKEDIGMRLANGEWKKEKNQREAYMIMGMKGGKMAASGVRPRPGLNPGSTTIGYAVWYLSAL